MKIRYYLVPNHVLEAEVSSFPEFRALLWGLLVGVTEDDASMLAGWAETYRRIVAEGLPSEICFARARAHEDVVLHVIGVER
jgi:hypothetical protein